MRVTPVAIFDTICVAPGNLTYILHLVGLGIGYVRAEDKPGAKGSEYLLLKELM